MKRVYCSETYSTNDERILESFNFIKQIIKEDKVDAIDIKRMSKDFTNIIRRIMGIDSVLAVGVSDEEKDKLYIITFDIPSTEDNHYTTLFDKERGEHYIEVGIKEEGVR